jgi:hypothetical protein
LACSAGEHGRQQTKVNRKLLGQKIKAQPALPQIAVEIKSFLQPNSGMFRSGCPRSLILRSPLKLPEHLFAFRYV